MNPSFLFPEIEASEWVHLQYEKLTSWIVVQCCCQDEIKWSLNPPTIKSVNRGRVECRPQGFTHKGQKAVILMGQCDDCKKAFWACESYHWLMWITPEQQWKMLLQEARVANFVTTNKTPSRKAMITVLDKYNTENVKREFTIIFDRDGSVQYLTYHTNEY